MAWIREATSAGARKRLACAEAGLSLRTFQRWTQEAGQISQDQRAQAQRPEPANKLSEQEREQVLAVCNQSDRAETGGPGRVSGFGIQLLSYPEGGGSAASSGPRESTTKTPASDHASSQSGQ